MYNLPHAFGLVKPSNLFIGDRNVALRDEFGFFRYTMEPISRRALGIAHPIAVNIQGELQQARALLRARKAGQKVVFVME